MREETWPQFLGRERKKTVSGEGKRKVETAGKGRGLEKTRLTFCGRKEGGPAGFHKGKDSPAVEEESLGPVKFRQGGIVLSGCGEERGGPARQEGGLGGKKGEVGMAGRNTPWRNVATAGTAAEERQRKWQVKSSRGGRGGTPPPGVKKQPVRHRGCGAALRSSCRGGRKKEERTL